jgi:hypothetical protein
MKNQPPTSLSTFRPETIPASDRQVEALTVDTGTLQHSASESTTALVSTFMDEQSSSDDSSDSSDVSSFHRLSLIIALETLPA